MPRAARVRQAGFSLVGLLAAATIMLILMAAAIPTWKHVMKDDREEELIFRGGQIADAIAAYQRKNANSMPVSIEVLVKGKFLRKAYKDPMTKSGKWRFVRQGEGTGGGPIPGGGRTGGQPNPFPAPSGPVFGGPPATPSPEPSPSASPGEEPTTGGGLGAPAGSTIGPFLGVASTSQDKSLRVFNGKTRYDQWIFAAGQPRIVGNQLVSMPVKPAMSPIPGGLPGGVPGGGPKPPVTQPPRRNP